MTTITIYLRRRLQGDLSLQYSVKALEMLFRKVSSFHLKQINREKDKFKTEVKLKEISLKQKLNSKR